jgi:hypothetical protein
MYLVCLTTMEPIFTIQLLSDSVKPEKLKDPSYLRSLCQKEVSHFEQYVQSVDPQFRGGLSKFERLAIEGYIYQKVRGHFDALDNQNHNSMEEHNG